MNIWLQQIFDSIQATEGNIVRRSISSVTRMCGVQTLIDAVRQRGYHMVKIGDQFVICCCPATAIEIIC